MEIIDGKPVNVDVAGRDFKYYIFDWDDNILHMPTRIYLEHRADDEDAWRPVSVSTGTFALVRTDAAHYRMPQDGGRAAAFRDFQDAPDAAVADLAFIRDTRAALARIRAGASPGPSFQTLRKTLREGRIFAIVTARGAAATIREAVKIFVDEVLTPSERAEMFANLRGYRYCFDRVEAFGTDVEELDYFLSMCRYHAVTNPGFKARMAGDADFGARLAEASSEQPRLRGTPLPHDAPHGRRGGAAAGGGGLLGRRSGQPAGGLRLCPLGTRAPLRRLQVRRLRHERPVP